MAGRVFYAGVMTETNTFSNIPTSYFSFEQTGILRGVEALYEPAGAPRAQLAPLFQFARQRGLDLVAGIVASASPGAPIQQHDYEQLRSEVLTRLRAALPVEAVFLNLHGAMVSTACWDCEGDLLGEVRALVGEDTPIGVVLDPHAHLTDAMIENASVLAFMKEYPHIDGGERAEDVLRIVGAMLDKEVRPTAAVADCRLIGFFPTQDEPMRGFVDRLYEREREAGVLSASFVHGFPWGDTPATGAKALVYTNADPARAYAVAEAIRDDIIGIRDQIHTPMIPVDEAVSLARRRRARPLVLADISDNPGGGAPSDSTFILRAFLDAGIVNAAIGLIYDPELVSACHEVGVGGQLDARIGGKTSRFSGQPVDLEVEVLGLARGGMMDVLGVAEFPMGDTAWIHGAGVDIVLSSLRLQMYAPSGFAHVGLDPATRSTLVVKSSNHFRAAFAELAGEIAVVATPGAIDFDFTRIPYRVFNEPYYPRVPDPFAGPGATASSVHRRSEK